MTANLTASEINRRIKNLSWPVHPIIEDVLEGTLKLVAALNEKDPHGKTAGEPGAKLDYGKSPVYRGTIEYFPRALMAVADVSNYGATKYSWKGWEQVPDGVNRYKDALGRHICKEGIEGPFDQEILNHPTHPAKIRHLAQVAWNALAALELVLRDQEK